jgi:hypothetical protein
MCDLDSIAANQKIMIVGQCADKEDRAAAQMPWPSEFDDPILLPNGRKLITLKDAGLHHQASESQARRA